jgi:Ca-activated chloride channel family protein
MRFENPGALWLLPGLALLFLGLALWGCRAKRETAETFQLNLRSLKRRQVEKYATGGAVMALLVAALALPELPTSSPRAPKAAGEIALLVDVSRSMAAQTGVGSPNRIERAKPILCEIVDRMEELGEVRISLHAFTNRARSLVPFVDKEDYPYLKVTVEKVLDTFATPGEGSSLGRSLSDVADKFSPDEKAKLVVLVSDGEGFIGVTRGMHEAERGWLDDAVKKAGELGIKVITIGIGERDGARIPLHDVEGEFTGEYAKLQGVDYISYLEEDSLREIASRTGGRYYFEEDREGLIEFIEENLAPAGAQEVTAEVRGYRYIAHWFVLAALPVWVIFARNYILR